MPKKNWGFAHAIESLSPKALKRELDAGEDPNLATSSGLLPLNLAIKSGRLELADMLVKRGANPNLSDKGGSPLNSAIIGEQLVLAAMLLSHGADPNLADQKQGYPLSLAVRKSSSEIVRLLLNHNADADPPDAIQGNPLNLAVKRKSSELVGMLLEHGADPNLYDERYGYPLFLAARRSTPEVLMLLVDHGAELNKVDQQDHSAINQAIPNWENVRTLLDRGAQPRPLEKSLAIPARFPDLAERQGFKQMSDRLRRLTNSRGSEYFLLPGSLTLSVDWHRLIAEPQSFAAFGKEVHNVIAQDGCLDDIFCAMSDEALRLGCILLCDHSMKRLYLLPCNDKYAALAATEVADWPDDRGPYEIAVQLQKIDAKYPFLIRGCGTRYLDLDFGRGELDWKSIAKMLHRIFCSEEEWDLEQLRTRGRILVWWEDY